MSGENQETIQAAQAIVACSGAVKHALAHDPQWLRRRSHGDPTAIPDLLTKVCDQQGLVAKVVIATIAADPALSALLTQTITLAQSQAEEEMSLARRWRISLGVGIPLAVVICVVAYIWTASKQREEPPSHGTTAAP
jgi:hypothetical protein